MAKVIVMDHPLILHKIGIIRRVETGSKDFRSLVSEIAMLMCYEATRGLKLTDIEITTPICKATVQELEGKKLAVVPILRAGLGMVEGMLTMIPAAKVGHIGLYRNEETLEPVEYYCKLPKDCAERDVFVVDPMDGDDPVHPIAHNVTDMLRLLLACGDMAAPAQAHMFDSKQSFGEFLIKCRPDSETREVLEAIGRGLDITPMPLPYKYLKELQDSFDMGAVPYTEEYYEVIG